MFLNNNFYNSHFKLPFNINFIFSIKLSCFFVFNSFGIFTLYLPSKYFYNNNRNISLVFLNNFFFKSFLNQLNILSTRLKVFYFFKLRIKGLGFRIRNISNTLYYFFFNYTNFFYLYPPKLLLYVFIKSVYYY